MNFEELFDDSATEPTPPTGEGMFRLQVHRPHREKVKITVAGPLDLATTARFADVLDARLRATTPTLVLDLSGVTFVGATAIEALLHADRYARATGQRLILITDTHAVDRVLQALDLTSRFTYGDQPMPDPAQTTVARAPRTPLPRRAPETAASAEASSQAATARW